MTIHPELSLEGKAKNVILAFPSFSTTSQSQKMAAHPCTAETLNKSEFVQLTSGQFILNCQRKGKQKM